MRLREHSGMINKDSWSTDRCGPRPSDLTQEFLFFPSIYPSPLARIKELAMLDLKAVWLTIRIGEGFIFLPYPTWAIYK